MNTFKPMTEKNAWVALGVVGLCTRLPLLHWFTTEMTDGVLCLTYFQWRLFEIPRFVIFPVYPALVALGASLGLMPESWGRLLSALFGILTVVPLWLLARRWASVEITFLACLAYLLSPLDWMWSLRVMPDTMFLFLFWQTVERVISFEESPDWKNTGAVILCAGAAFGVRPEGFFLVLFSVWVLGKEPRYRVWGVLLLLGVLASSYRSPIRSMWGHAFGSFQEGAMGVESPVAHFLGNFWVYLTQPAWVFSPILFFLSAGGFFVVMGLSDSTGRFWRRRLLALLGSILLFKMVPTNYQDRHLLVFLPAVCILAALKLQNMETAWKTRYSEMDVLVRRNGLAAMMLGFLIVFSCAVLVFQKDSFGDVVRSARYLSTLPSDAVVYSDEQFKTEYTSNRTVRVWAPQVRDIRPGDYLVFHTFNTPRLNVLEKTLNLHFKMEIAYQDYSYVLPLLTDLMMDPQLQNRPQAASVRFEPQYFETRVYRVVKKIPRPKEEGWDG